MYSLTPTLTSRRSPRGRDAPGDRGWLSSKPRSGLREHPETLLASSSEVLLVARVAAARLLGLAGVLSQPGALHYRKVTLPDRAAAAEAELL